MCGWVRCAPSDPAWIRLHPFLFSRRLRSLDARRRDNPAQRAPMTLHRGSRSRHDRSHPDACSRTTRLLRHADSRARSRARVKSYRCDALTETMSNKRRVTARPVAV